MKQRMHLLQVSDSALKLLAEVLEVTPVVGQGIESAGEVRGQIRIALAVAGLALVRSERGFVLAPVQAKNPKPEAAAAGELLGETLSEAGKSPAELPVKRSRKR